MTLTPTLLRSLGATILVALTVASGSASAEGGPVITVGSGCAAQCIKKALVTVTATTAKVELETTVPAHLKVYVTKQSAPSGGRGGIVLNQTMLETLSAFSPTKTVWFSSLVPNTKYSIVVQATDLQGRKASQKGSFKTLPIATTGQGGPDGLSSGLGCAAECIQRALFTQTRPAATIVNADLRTAVDAQIRVIVSRDKPHQTASGPAQYDVVSAQQSPGYVRSWKTQIGGLSYGRVYHVVVHAKDTERRTSIRVGKFQTVTATSHVTIHKLKILNDGDKYGRGELFFRYWASGQNQSSNGYRKADTGTVITAKAAGAGRPGVTFEFPANDLAGFTLHVTAEECDTVWMKNCVVEAADSAGNTSHDAVAGGTFDLRAILEGGALPGWHGTGVTPPAGHDGYFVFGTTKTYVKFLALATVDIQINWP